MQFGPLQGRVLDRRIEHERKTAGGGIIPNAPKYKAHGEKDSFARRQVDDPAPFRHVAGL